MITAVTSTSFVEVTLRSPRRPLASNSSAGRANTGVAYFSDDPDHATQCEIRADPSRWVVLSG